MNISHSTYVSQLIGCYKASYAHFLTMKHYIIAFFNKKINNDLFVCFDLFLYLC